MIELGAVKHHVRAAGVSIAAAIGAFLLLGDAAIGRADRIEDEALKRRVAIWASAVLIAVLAIVAAIIFAAR